MREEGSSPLIERASAPTHLFATPELDFSQDLFAEPLKDGWFRLAASTRGSPRHGSVSDVVERRCLLIEPGVFPTVSDKLDAVGNALSGLGAPSEVVSNFGSENEVYSYRPFHSFEIFPTGAEGEPLAFVREAESTRDLALNPDLPLYFKLEEKPDGVLWDPARSVEVIRHLVIDNGELELIEIRSDYLLKYLRARQKALLIGHYRHFHFFAPPQAAIDTFVKEDLVLKGAHAKAILNNWGLRTDVFGDEPFLQRRLHLWFEIEPPPLDVDAAFDEEPDFDVAAFTFPMRQGPVAPARFRRYKLKDGESFSGVSCDFMDRVYFRQEALAKYQGASGFQIDDDGSLHCGTHWGLTRSTHRIGNELLSSAIGDFAEGVPYHEWEHWRGHVVPPPSSETVRALDQECAIPKAVNCVIEELDRLNSSFEQFAEAAGVQLTGKLWKGSLDSLAGRQLKWIYPATADDSEFLTRATLASTLFIDALDVQNLRRVLMAFGSELHLNADKKTLGSRNLLQRMALLAQLICTVRPEPGEMPDLVAWSELQVGAPSEDLQGELNRGYGELRQEFAPLAFLYDLRLYAGLAHPPNQAGAALAATKLGLPDQGWRRADYLALLQRVHYAVEAVMLRVQAAADAFEYLNTVEVS